MSKISEFKPKMELEGMPTETGFQSMCREGASLANVASGMLVGVGQGGLLLMMTDDYKDRGVEGIQLAVGQLEMAKQVLLAQLQRGE